MRDFISDNFGAIWPAHVSNLTDHLIEARRVFGDLDLMIVLAVIGDRSLSERRTDKSLSYEQLFKERQGHPEPEDINLSSISDYTGIPRETTRRKLNDLVDRGWVEKNEKGFLKVTQKCSQDLESLTKHGMKYLDNMFSILAVTAERAKR